MGQDLNGTWIGPNHPNHVNVEHDYVYQLAKFQEIYLKMFSTSCANTRDVTTPEVDRMVPDM